MPLDPANEALLKYFNDRGYQPIRLPYGGAVPPDIYFLDGMDYYRFCDLEDTLTKRAAFDTELQVVAGFGDQQVSEKSAKLGFAFLRGVAERWGIGGAPALHANAQRGEDILLQFDNVQNLRAEPGKIEQALNSGVKADLIGRDRIEKGIVHIAYEYIYASNVKVSTGEQTAAGASAGATLGQTVEVTLEAAAKHKNGSTVSFGKAGKLVAIGFKVARLKHEHGRYLLELKQSPGLGLNQYEGELDDYIFRTGLVLEINEWEPR